MQDNGIKQEFGNVKKYIVSILGFASQIHAWSGKTLDDIDWLLSGNHEEEKKERVCRHTERDAWNRIDTENIAACD